MRAAAAQATGRGFYGGAVDVWALGCLAYELLTGESPFAAESESRTVRNILAANAALEKLESMAAARDFLKARRRCARGHPLPRTAHSPGAAKRPIWSRKARPARARVPREAARPGRRFR